jgi:hypothetical protein
MRDCVTSSARAPSRRTRSVAILVAVLMASRHVLAQPVRSPAASFATRPDTGVTADVGGTFLPATVAPALPPSRRAPWIAPMASFLLPGSGQVLLRQQRAYGYVVADGFLIIQALRANRDGNNTRNEYRRLASEVARAPFGADRPHGSWDYYETLEAIDASGAYELSPGSKFTPESDVTTYNGRKWLQARQTYWADANVPPPETSPEYARAIAFYQARAYSGSFRFSWRDHQLEQTAYVQTIKDYNGNRQRLVSTGGLLLANHLVSMVDAYINVRVRRYGGAGLANVSVRSGVEPAVGAANSYRASLTATLLLPRR